MSKMYYIVTSRLINSLIKLVFTKCLISIYKLKLKLFIDYLLIAFNKAFNSNGSKIFDFFGVLFRGI